MRDRPLMDILRGMGGTASAGQLVSAGARWEDIYRLRDGGELLELSRGIYRLANAPATAHVDFVAVCRRVPHGTICLNSAASYWDLTDEMPDHVHLGIPRGRNRPVIKHPPTRIHVFAKETFGLGRIAEPVETGETIAISSPERTVVDLVRLRGQVGRDQALSALRRYLDWDHAKPSDLLSLARCLRAGKVVGEAMELLLA